MLRIENLFKSFGGVVATSDVSIHFSKESLSAVIGPNGAGKTTFFNLISGALQPDSGKILLDGENIVGMPSSEIVHRGIGRAFQVAKLLLSENAPKECLEILSSFQVNYPGTLLAEETSQFLSHVRRNRPGIMVRFSPSSAPALVLTGILSSERAGSVQ